MVLQERVLILVVMEDSLGLTISDEVMKEVLKVLILVVMEDSLGRNPIERRPMLAHLS